ncbi:MULTISPECIES: LamB/YcsF family protein [unclassified Pseudomonas]|uniref:LamB/YcsF family protein n=1 Tax=unclassified Pseudomonas TaxID=196821 RepID=UPI00131D4D6E|nr:MULTISPECIES: 5-oxoprolinase subunit PxpA [unclassified Pseudomonas]
MLIDLNCDMGEGFGAWKMGDDSAMLDIVTSANIACGFHAGDPDIMFATAAMAQEKGVAVGAHPSFLDILGFGRRQIRGDSPAQIERQIIYQIGAFKALSEAAGLPLQHVKTHGALGNMANEDPELAMAVARAIKAVDQDLIFVVMPGLETERAAERVGLPLAREIYADRAYAANGNLVSRKLPGAVIHDSDVAAARVLRMIEDQAIITIAGERMPVQIDTVCVHGDTPGATTMAMQLRTQLENAGVRVTSMATVINR